ncbi:hypothetical protein [Sphingomonas nostoxanthinifaciens]|nr:hypothetical protein [Sphingomonas nostoxanthinifaciens]UAK25517.1 hypothetical protein K8P63_04965 [Sphingomonas nostoxanthinifaciens]
MSRMPHPPPKADGEQHCRDYRLPSARARAEIALMRMAAGIGSAAIGAKV